MEITIEKINVRNDPYQLFLDSIKNKETSRRYRNLLYTFLKLIPNQVFQDVLGKTPNDRKVETLAEFLMQHCSKDVFEDGKSKKTNLNKDHPFSLIK